MWRSYEDFALESLKNYKEVARKVKEVVRRIDPEAEVYVFGSVVKGRYTAASDIDVLIVTKKVGYRYRMMVEVYRKVKAPVELHVTTPEKLSSWYRRFIKPEELIKVT